MQAGFLPFALVPLIVYTYFWVNPLAFATFIEGLSKYIVEIYLGFKEWKIEYETKKAYRRYMAQSKKMAKENGFSWRVVELYFETYSEDDWKTLRQRQRQSYEDRYKDIEETMREMLLF